MSFTLYDDNTVLILADSFKKNLGKLIPECQTILQFDASTHEEGCSDDNQNSALAPVKSPPEYQHSVFSWSDAFHVAQPIVLNHRRHVL